MTADDINEKKELLLQSRDYENTLSTSTRGRSLLCGTCHNGMVEIVIRGDGDRRLWVPLTPPEIGEFIHQLAASIGCVTNIQPRKDFLTWRNWTNEEENNHGSTMAIKKNNK